MSTAPVRFEFHCDGGQKTLRFVHAIPKELVCRSQLVGDKSGSDVRPARAATATSTLQHVLSWPNKVDDPVIGVYVCAVCERRECEMGLRQELGVIMGEITAHSSAGSWSQTRELVICQVCGKTAGVKKCGGCLVVGYCNKEHQRSDWKEHKKMCRRYSL
ncbi:MYND finger domain-containing protein [Purpureocillium lilacinum]|uniref:MYND finger domain-containing protein n=1 Tax=Purpureocillium lilacinum TaxID=33203 RepID=A0A179F6R9_PURLI|nr:MYND finger domain-containing protein [Purpureocillium lilacinum]